MATIFPTRHNITVYEGDTYTLPVTYREGVSEAALSGVNLTDATLAGQIRESAASDTVLATWTCTASNQTTNRGEMVCTLPPAESEALDGTQFVYDIEITWPDGSVQTIIYGSVSVTRGVTR